MAHRELEGAKRDAPVSARAVIALRWKSCCSFVRNTVTTCKCLLKWIIVRPYTNKLGTCSNHFNIALSSNAFFIKASNIHLILLPTGQTSYLAVGAAGVTGPQEASCSLCYCRVGDWALWGLPWHWDVVWFTRRVNAQMGWAAGSCRQQINVHATFYSNMLSQTLKWLIQTGLILNLCWFCSSHSQDWDSSVPVRWRSPGSSLHIADDWYCTRSYWWSRTGRVWCQKRWLRRCSRGCRCRASRRPQPCLCCSPVKS